MRSKLADENLITNDRSNIQMYSLYPHLYMSALFVVPTCYDTKCDQMYWDASDSPIKCHKEILYTKVKP